MFELGGEVVAHASVVERELHAGARALRTGYVEAVATAPDRQGSGFGSLLMAESRLDQGRFDLGALGTGRQRFYERQGWLIWAGPTFVRTREGAPDTRGGRLHHGAADPDVSAARADRTHQLRLASRRRLVRHGG